MNVFNAGESERDERINTLLKGFVKHVGGIASSFSNTGDLILIGKNKRDMMKAFERMKEIGGGIVIVDNDRISFELPLPLAGLMSDLPMESLIKKETEFRHVMKERGYKFDDPMYTILFFTSTHLPYIRLTPAGVYDVMKKRVLFPSIMR